MRRRRLGNRAQRQMIMLRLQPREQIARDRRQLACQPAGAVGGDLKAQKIAEQRHHHHSPNRIMFLLCSYRSEEHTTELQSLMRISYAVCRLKKKNKSTQLK